MQRILRIVLSVFSVLPLACTGSTDTRIAHQMDRKAAPDFELKDCDGNRVALRELRGKPVIVAFFAHGCGPCRVEATHLSELATAHADDGLQVLAVNAWDEDVTLLRKYAAEEKLRQRILVDGGATAEAYGLAGSVPAVFWIDRQGTIVDTDWGFSGATNLQQKTQRLLRLN